MKGVVSWVARRAMARERLVVFMVVSIACFCFVLLLSFSSSVHCSGLVRLGFCLRVEVDSLPGTIVLCQMMWWSVHD